MRSLPEVLRNGAEEVARRLQAAGHEAWLVGGAVRDLALGGVPGDADLTTDAHPEMVEALFSRTHAVGKAFGTIIVLIGELDIEVTSFRAEEGYGDGRRPDHVRYGATLEEDAKRRDFTCNALYLHPLRDELADPTGGMRDLERGVLACVGDPVARFAEDGLRLLRLARFAAALQLEVEPETLQAARAAVERIAGVSAERVLKELLRMAELEGAATAFGLLDEIKLLGRFLPYGAPDLDALRRLGPAPGGTRLLGTLLATRAASSPEQALAAVESLRPARQLLRSLEELFALLARLETVLAMGAGASRGARILLYRDTAWEDACAVYVARRGAGGGWGQLLKERAALGPADLRPAPWVTSADLVDLGVPPGPSFGELLGEAERHQLDGLHASRDEALAWLRGRLQDGGNTRRK